MAEELAYNAHVEAFRDVEYPMLKDAIYLDHAGSALASKSLMEQFMSDMMSNLYGNPHSGSPSSQLTTNRIEDVRLKVLQFFKADPEEFDVVFVANATAGIKLVMSSFQSRDAGFNYGYHVSSHTSLIGVRETAASSKCLEDCDVEEWLASAGSFVEGQDRLNLFAYPAQSNLDGGRLPMSWCHRSRKFGVYSLLDASAMVSTAQLDLSNAIKAPDFTVLSFYKIFGFPDLGALIVRRESGTILRERKYFGGGTVDMVLCVKEQWHYPKVQSLHDALEDGTLPFHNISSLDAAIEVHKNLYGSMDKIAKHTGWLAKQLYSKLASLKHYNSEPVCVMHPKNFLSRYSVNEQGPIVAFNLRNSHGAWISNTEFEKLASVRNFNLRTGGLCNPGGIAKSLNLEAWEMRRNFSSGFKCDTDTDIYAGKITGMIRASLGAMSTLKDVLAFVSFLEEFYVEEANSRACSQKSIHADQSTMHIESLTIYPIKSCGGFNVPRDTSWEVRPEGLVWDREFCLVHHGTGQALSQKRYPRMALIRPKLDFTTGTLRISYIGETLPGLPAEISIPLSANPSLYNADQSSRPFASRVCGDSIFMRTYKDNKINDFFSRILEVSCLLARFPAGGSGLNGRHAKAHMQKHQRPKGNGAILCSVNGDFPSTPPDSDNENPKRPILLSNESPILAINRSSIDALNHEITKTGGKTTDASVFRANVVLAPSTSNQVSSPYCEDHWSTLSIGEQSFQMLGSCRRCHMICVDQNTASKNNDVFVTLAKTRRFDSKIFFGSHMCHIPSKIPTKDGQCPTIRVGDSVRVGT